MKGIQFLVDEQGNAKSVVLDLEEWGDLWEDFYDGILAQNALNEGPMIPWETLKAELDAELEQGEEWQVSLVDGRWIFHSVLISVSKRTETIIRQIKRRIRSVVTSLSTDPRPPGYRNLRGYDRLYRVRVGNYRIIYEIDDVSRLISIARLNHRRDVYRSL